MPESTSQRQPGREPFGRVPEWLLDSPDVPDKAKLLYAVLTRYAGRVGNAFPSETTLAARLGCSGRQLRRAIGKLEEAKAVRVVRAPGRLNSYELADTPDIHVLGSADTSVRGVRTPVSGECGHFVHEPRTSMSETEDMGVLLSREEVEKEVEAPPDTSTPSGVGRRQEKDPDRRGEAYHLGPRPYRDPDGFWLGLDAELPVPDPETGEVPR